MTDTASPLSRPIELSNTGRGTRPPLVPSLLLILVPTIRGDRNASGGLAALSWKPLEYRPNKRPLAQRIHKRRPDEGQGTRNISQKNEASIKPPDAKKVKFAEDAPLQYVLSSQSIMFERPLMRWKQDRVGIKRWPFEVTTSAGIRKVCQRGSSVCQGHFVHHITREITFLTTS
jgi:hypothetical protein